MLSRKLLPQFWLLGLLTLAILLLSYLIAQGTTYEVDTYLLRLTRDAAPDYHPLGSPKLQSIIRDVTSLGSGTVLTFLTIVVAIYLLLVRENRAALFVAGSILLGWLAMEGIKLVYNRPRPTVVPHLMQEASLSLPSGHAMMSTVVFFTLAGVFSRRSNSRSITRFAYLLAGLLAFTIGCTRIYLGVHHPSDVLAGWLLGLLWALGASLLYQRFGYT